MGWRWRSLVSSPSSSTAVSASSYYSPRHDHTFRSATSRVCFPCSLSALKLYPNTTTHHHHHHPSIVINVHHCSCNLRKICCTRLKCTTSSSELEVEENDSQSETLDCIGTGLDVECRMRDYEEDEQDGGGGDVGKGAIEKNEGLGLWEWTVLISPFFFWGSAMVAMKEVLPKTGPFFVAAFRLIPAGFMLVAFAAYRGRKMPSGFNAGFRLLSLHLLMLLGFLAEGLQRTSAGLGSVIIDSQPLTVAILASLLFGESIGLVGAAGLLLGVVGLSLLELPALAVDSGNFSLWGSGEWWMLLSAQSMAVGTVMVLWVTKYSDPVMATGWVVFRSLPRMIFFLFFIPPSSEVLLVTVYTSTARQKPDKTQLSHLSDANVCFDIWVYISRRDLFTSATGWSFGYRGSYLHGKLPGECKMKHFLAMSHV
ncbi:hypothetical protein ACFE04_006333 [Oxalis oulophora]